jgi:NAD(P)-dependent dehydrogenase (short-subunit alcohol dehydrogenase family)
MNIIVNGGTRGIGREVVLFLAKEPDNQVIVTGRSIRALSGLSDSSPNIHAVEVDLSALREDAGRFSTALLSCFDRVDVLINMAGMLVAKEFMNLSDDEARQMMETNFFGIAGVIKILKPYMPAGSHIVNISSMGGYQGSMKFKGLSLYSASKAAIACLSECLAEEFRESGISVNCLALGAVQTEMLNEAFPGYTAPVSAGEMARFISYFALNANRFMNGRIIPVAVNTP